jgi:hypothetical protein
MHAVRNVRAQHTAVHLQDGHSSMVSSLPPSRAEVAQSGTPAPGERAVVRCDGFQCLAYRDSTGRWREASDKKRLPQVLDIILRF